MPGRSTRSLGFTLIIVTITVDDYIAAHRLHYARARGNLYGVALVVTVVGVAIAISGVKWAPIVLFAGIGGLVGNLVGGSRWPAEEVTKALRSV